MKTYTDEQITKVLNALALAHVRHYSDCYIEAVAILDHPVVQEPVAWGQPDALGNIVDTISPDDKLTDMKMWADQYSVPLYKGEPK
jgi:hypothetical protein